MGEGQQIIIINLERKGSSKYFLYICSTDTCFLTTTSKKINYGKDFTRLTIL